MKICELLAQHGININEPICVLKKGENNDAGVTQWIGVYHLLTNTLGTPAQFARRWNWLHPDYGYIILDECFLPDDTDRLEVRVRKIPLHDALAAEAFEDSLLSPVWSVILPRGVMANTSTVREYDLDKLRQDQYNIGILDRYSKLDKPIYVGDAGKQALLYQLLELNEKRNKLIGEILA